MDIQTVLSTIESKRRGFWDRFEEERRYGDKEKASQAYGAYLALGEIYDEIKSKIK